MDLIFRGKLAYNGSLCSVRFLHRRSSYKELQYICDGDSNGVLYFAGTSYGEHQWVNPVLAKVNHLNHFSFNPFLLLCSCNCTHLC